jgi:adenylosuccinate lyase
LQIRESLQILEGDLDTIISDLTDLSRKYRDVPMAGRSNLQQAVPITFGFKCARFLATFRRHRQRLNELKKRVYTLEFGGAAGNLVSLGSGGLATQEALAKQLDLNVPEIAWHTEHDRFAEVGSFLALLTGTCAKLSMDVKLMMQTEVGEVSERYEKDRGSSSTMPQKRNPISCCYIHAMASSVRHSSAALMDSLVSAAALADRHRHAYICNIFASTALGS